ncbi:hypothetical protein F2P45_10695 [Massilia sp. CCM 8733]|uniref:Uncharacterized protein n=1 Tax=Massilia mucilaginosa TaxID=2609282 RepID=A0ABX0NRE9_9BURK|nr:hypothetical protein [Massilia mucilaginosa]NHZ89478.1 hypothetical protein [Massilia mucilaginosa]
MRIVLACLIASQFAAPGAMACQPLAAEFWAETPRRVKSNFDGAQFVVAATVIDVKMVHEAKPPYPDFKMKFERARFRVDRVFKGTLKAGDTFVIDSGISSCGRGVAPETVMVVGSGFKMARSQDYPKQWLIYHTSPPHLPNSPMQMPAFEIEDSPLSRPLERAAYDLTILEKLRGG